MANLWIRKPLDKLTTEAGDSEKSLKRTLGPMNLIALGIGAIIGAGLFVRTAAAIAEHAGPSVTIGFIVAGIGCAFAGLCYAEFASMIPIAGSAYTYSYATMGEFVAWIIGWDLVLEYAVGAATVAIAWSQYLNKLLEFMGVQIPYEWCHSPFEHVYDAATKQAIQSGVVNVPAVVILLLLTLVLIRGTQQSAMLNGIIVVTKVAIVVMVIVFGWGFMNPANHANYIPERTTYTSPSGMTNPFGGIVGILGAAGVVFFAFIGFDAVSTAAQEAKNPKKDMPTGILGSLVVCTVLYILFSHVLSGLAPIEDFRTQGKEASVAYAITHYMPGFGWLAKLVTIAILAGFSSVILVMLLGQSRVFYSMSRDGLIPGVFSEVHPKYRTPYKSNWIFFVVTAIFAAFFPDSIVGNMTSIGTLFAFILVCAGVWILRVREPDRERGFKAPMVPVVPILGIVVCGAMIYGLDVETWYRLIGWLIVGMFIYFGYSRHHSRLQREAAGGGAPPSDG